MPDASAPPPAPSSVPDYPFAQLSDRSRGWRGLIPGWRWARNGGANRPSNSVLNTYAKVFVKRLRVPTALLHEGLPSDPSMKRLVVRFVSAVQGRIHWYEATLSSRNLWYQLGRAGVVLLVGAAVAFVIWDRQSADSATHLAAVGAALSFFANFALSARNEKGEIEAFITALQALKKQLAAFENEWDDVLAASNGWPTGFAAALQAAMAQADEVEDAERFAVLQAALGGFTDASTMAQTMETPLGRVLATRPAKPGGPTPLQVAETELAVAVEAEKRAAAQDWGPNRDAVMFEFQRARFDAETKVARLRREAGSPQ